MNPPIRLTIASLPRASTGFTLVELAVVMLIIVVLLGGLLVPLSAQMDARKGAEAQRALGEIRDALLGFAVAHGRLPCPSTENDPNNVNYGVEEASCSTSLTVEGYLPWKTLGVSEIDPWGIQRTSAAQPRTGAWRYRVDRNFATAFTLAATFSDNLRIADNAGNDLTSSSERAVAIVFSTGPNTTPDGQNASFEPTNPIYQAGEQTPTFDDILIWIGRPVLFNRMVAAGRLP